MTAAGFCMYLAGAVGFEPTNGGTKSRCLTTWRRPSDAGALIEMMGSVGSLDVTKMLGYRRTENQESQ